MSPRSKSPSFSFRVKEELRSAPVKKGCCRHAFSDALALAEADGDRCEMIRSEKFMCPGCHEHYIAGLFVTFGNVSDPAKSHHLEFSFPHEAERDAVLPILSDLGFTPKVGCRKGRYIAYFKKSDDIEDLLAKIGASAAVFDYINSRIVKGIRNDANRQVNFDSANIEKSLDAAKNHLDVINRIIESGLFNELGGELRETALLRLEFPEATLAQLGLKFSKPISKSGVNHRIEKITEFAKSKNLI